MREKISEGKLKAEGKAFSGEGPVSDLKEIPGIGAKMAQHMHNIGIQCIADLKGRDPEELYHLDCLKKGFQEDRCALYVYRCAVYFAEHEEREPEKYKVAVLFYSSASDW